MSFLSSSKAFAIVNLASQNVTTRYIESCAKCLAGRFLDTTNKDRWIRRRITVLVWLHEPEWVKFQGVGSVYILVV
ncbi:hypothetical protein PM082_016499 [Marasmius tenuissimus]|nr:hypothetical protein PM082_016499 [Marasmius tenuissimus]